MNNYWLVKTEPETFSYSDLEKERISTWDGVRNYQARNNLKAMKTGDQVLIYHSVTGKEIVGLAEVFEEFFQDPTTENPNWVAVKLKPLRRLDYAVTLETVKKEEKLQNLLLVKHSRLSVMPVDKEEFNIIMKLSQKD